MTRRMMRAGVFAAAFMLALPLCVSAADEPADTADKARKEAREIRDDAREKTQEIRDDAKQKAREVRDATEKKMKNVQDGSTTQEEKDEATMNRLQKQEDQQSAGEYMDDAAVTTKVKGKFVGQKGLDSLDIKVVTVDGTVTLMGDVDDKAQIGLAEKVAREVKGVKAVDNRLVVKK
ncbi:putative Osmotically inducible periplasmic protein [uncultured delta proteobacterium]|uniref:Putative Osmotically inducible periplasmic protein n=1 Tax=uncultured delta proteobacterium TaxID=34034 RepID=A0A212JL15_9DELT|nr:putative Osmotically inducible periplasmic protein [uncultured delta proteobacterium]